MALDLRQLEWRVLHLEKNSGANLPPGSGITKAQADSLYRSINWTPTAADVGALTESQANLLYRSATWLPKASEVGALTKVQADTLYRPSSWTPSADDIGALIKSKADTLYRAITWMPSAADVGALDKAHADALYAPIGSTGGGGTPVNAYTKAESDAKYRTIADSYTKTEVDNKIAAGGSGGGAVTSVNTKTGAVVLNASDVGALTKTQADFLYRPVGWKPTAAQIGAEPQRATGLITGGDNPNTLHEGDYYVNEKFSGAPTVKTGHYEGVLSIDKEFDEGNGGLMTYHAGGQMFFKVQYASGVWDTDWTEVGGGSSGGGTTPAAEPKLVIRSAQTGHAIHPGAHITLHTYSVAADGTETEVFGATYYLDGASFHKASLYGSNMTVLYKGNIIVHAVTRTGELVTGVIKSTDDLANTGLTGFDVTVTSSDPTGIHPNTTLTVEAANPAGGDLGNVAWYTLAEVGKYHQRGNSITIQSTGVFTIVGVAQGIAVPIQVVSTLKSTA